jgi:hypothetical protein
MLLTVEARGDPLASSLAWYDGCPFVEKTSGVGRNVPIYP